MTLKLWLEFAVPHMSLIGLKDRRTVRGASEEHASAGVIFLCGPRNCQQLRFFQLQEAWLVRSIRVNSKSDVPVSTYISFLLCDGFRGINLIKHESNSRS